MPRLAICSRDLHWQWINWAPLYDTMEVSMLRLTWLTVAQHVFQPALTGRLELISRKIGVKNCLLRTGNKGQRGWADFAKNCLPRIGSKKLPRFREKYRALGRQKVGSNMRPRYIQFRDIRDRDISGLHCIGHFHFQSVLLLSVIRNCKLYFKTTISFPWDLNNWHCLALITCSGIYWWVHARLQ